MTAATNRRALIQDGDDAIPRKVGGKLLANAIAKRGWLMLRTAAGFITQTATAGCTSAGMALLDADNTGGADGAVSIDLVDGVVDCAIGTSGDALVDADAPCPCYFIDNATVGKLPGSGATVRSGAGVFMGLDAENGQAMVLVGPAGEMLSRALQAQRIQTGTVTLVSGTKTLAAGITVTSSSKVFVSPNTAAGTDGINYEAPDASLVVGGPGTGSITINSISSAGAVVTTDTSTVNYMIVG